MKKNLIILSICGALYADTCNDFLEKNNLLVNNINLKDYSQIEREDNFNEFKINCSYLINYCSKERLDISYKKYSNNKLKEIKFSKEICAFFYKNNHNTVTKQK